MEGQTAQHDSNIHDVVFRRRSLCRSKVECSHSRRQEENINNRYFLFHGGKLQYRDGTAEGQSQIVLKL